MTAQHPGCFALSPNREQTSVPVIARKLSEPGRITIGRAKDADVVLSDPLVSENHSRIRYGQDGVFIDDCDSMSGTLLNGARIVTEVALHDGDAVCFGKTELWVHLDGLARTQETETRTDATSGAESGVRRGDQSTPFQGWGTTSNPDSRPGSNPDVTKIDGLGGLPHYVIPNLVIPLHREVTVIGRDKDCTFQLRHPSVSRHHLEVICREGFVQLRDLRSANGTYLNGCRVTGRSRLRTGDCVRAGSLELRFDGKHLTSNALKCGAGLSDTGTRIDLVELGKQVNDRRSGAPIWLLQGINLTIKPQEFVGVFGTTGCGKSTIFDAVNGRGPATSGTVLYNGQNLYNNFDAFRAGIGYVPQNLIFHSALTVVEALSFSAELRLPPDTSTDEIHENIDRVLDEVRLTERKNMPICNLSGGQKKRVSIAIELLCKPSVLFLDEATSGLDLRTEAEMMRMFREVADSGVTTLCITHYADSLDTCDKLVYLVSGRLAFCGSPGELKEHFGVRRIRDVYELETGKTPEEWAEKFCASGAWKRHAPASVLDTDTSKHERTRLKPGDVLGSAEAMERKKQMSVLTRRYVRVLASDRRTLILLLSLAPIIGGLIRFRFATELTGADEIKRQLNVCFGVSVGMFFMGVFGAVREVVKELRIYRHERFANLEILPYLGSKAAVLAGVNVVQAAVMYLVVCRWGPLDLGSTSVLGAICVMFLIAFAATLLGLAVSCAVTSSDDAVVMMVALIMPQILFTHALGTLTGILNVIGALFVPTYWGFDAVCSMLNPDIFFPHLELRNKHSLWGSVVAMLMFCSLYALLAVIFLQKKDGPYGKLYAIPGLDEGRSMFRSLIKRLNAQEVRDDDAEDTSV